MAEQDDTLVSRRSKRSNAGNRMEAVMAEFLAEAIPVEAEEDEDFLIAKEEEDAFDFDFESTDEEVEGSQTAVDDVAEKIVLDEERRARKTARTKLDRVTAAAHERQKATFHPELIEAPVRKPSGDKMKRRVSLGVAINLETGEVVEGASRKSRRTHTMLNTSATVSRLKNAEEKRSTVPRKQKTKEPPPTQAELIARALAMEEGNIKEHTNYLSTEEEKRKKARLVRTAVQGPLVRWVSRIEEEMIRIMPPPPPRAPAPTHYPYTSAQSTGSVPARSQHHYPPHPPPAYAGPSAPPTQSAAQPRPFLQLWPPANLPAAPPPVPAPEPIERIQKVTKNYVVHELEQVEKAPRPSWGSTMKGMFGDHVDWEELRVYTAKGRPLTRPTQICPISGKVAKYLDPRTNVPFANVAAYDVLSKILSHQYVWSDNLECYVGYDDGY